MENKSRTVRAASLALLACIAISSFFIFSAAASDSPTPPTAENCRAACLYDKTHGKFIVMENADLILNTSTSAKVMMGLLACELLCDRLDESVTLTDAMLQGASGNSMGLRSGESIKIIDLLYGAICGSYNDAGYAVAYLCAGSAQSFADMMNDRAITLGAASTNYTNPIGYPDNDAMTTTLSDTLKIALAASDNELYMEICSKKSYDTAATNLSPSRTVYNRNCLVSSRTTQAYYNPVCSGMNAGVTGDAGGWSVITLARDEDTEYICIILGGEESEDGEIYAYKNANSLIDWACDTYNSYKVFDKDQVLGKAEIYLTALGSQRIDYAAANELSVYIPDRSDPEITYKINYNRARLEAPMTAGTVIGYVTVYCNGERVGECDIILSEDCESNVLVSAINSIGTYTKSRAFIATLICFIILLPTVLFFNGRRSRKRYTRKY